MKDLALTLTAQEIRDLQDLLASPGWRLLTTYVDREWGAVGFGEKIAQTIGTLNDEGMALKQLQQATVTQREVQRILHWPQKTINDGRRAIIAEAQLTGQNRGGV